ncbi:hypothetical protein EMIHUDRAFT_223806 [Emiliania huxleyi CCMP1516]|uniref:Uncharacterized protein n=2 Tax=Emiliania huxleyi TaxID=2903 RepID=A0A0D3KT87_EMIH1|nr:hypothetical protein EMIHUDRAFT_223806 [Emiliania huxleyi CCMP1516]EOD38972.1 hypothetical protein EMIHUDRAFT_223806 [Emiliania huxleyi CCMP1516]|eukprot:XP_005791401.1 hypothetical protein EMIHUDRAFT_223806 [Emiliania huxleyi CCMP1516]
MEEELEWRTDHALVGARVARSHEGQDGELASSIAVVVGWLSAKESDFVDGDGKAAPLFRNVAEEDEILEGLEDERVEALRREVKAELCGREADAHYSADADIEEEMRAWHAAQHAALDARARRRAKLGERLVRAGVDVHAVHKDDAELKALKARRATADEKVAARKAKRSAEKALEESNPTSIVRGQRTCANAGANGFAPAHGGRAYAATTPAEAAALAEQLGVDGAHEIDEIADVAAEMDAGDANAAALAAALAAEEARGLTDAQAARVRAVLAEDDDAPCRAARKRARRRESEKPRASPGEGASAKKKEGGAKPAGASGITSYFKRAPPSGAKAPTPRTTQLEKQRRRRLEADAEAASKARAEGDGDGGETLLNPHGAAAGDAPLRIAAPLATALKPHQLEGCRFLFDNIVTSLGALAAGDGGLGAVLAHSMGLGKSLQVVALLHTLLHAPGGGSSAGGGGGAAGQVRTAASAGGASARADGRWRALLVVPVTVLPNWETELRKWTPAWGDRLRVASLDGKHAASAKDRAQLVRAWARGAHDVLLVGYEQLRAAAQLLRDLLNPGPDLVVCDEAHVLKNANAGATKVLKAMATRRRIALTGTPMQNSLLEYYAMVDFRRMYRRLLQWLQSARDADASGGAGGLFKVFQIGRRVWAHPSVLPIADGDAALDGAGEGSVESPEEAGAAANVETGGVDGSGTATRLATDEVVDESALVRDGQADDAVAPLLRMVEAEHDDASALALSGKMVLALGIVERAAARGERSLVFSSSLGTLDFVEGSLRSRLGWRRDREYFVIKGSCNLRARAQAIAAFNGDRQARAKCFLLSTGAGALGVNLVGANHVVLMDVSFNPAVDAQAVCRAFRYGQTRAVHVYRLIAAQTMEAKIYKRQSILAELLGMGTGTPLDATQPAFWVRERHLHEPLMEECAEEKLSPAEAALAEWEEQTGAAAVRRVGKWQQYRTSAGGDAWVDVETHTRHDAMPEEVGQSLKISTTSGLMTIPVPSGTVLTPGLSLNVQLPPGVHFLPPAPP